jgi:transcriptional regulator with XRE-family HTH domain
MQFSSARLRTFREEAHLSRQALADASGVSKSTIKRLETGDGTENMTLATISALATALGRDGSVFFEETAA